MIEYSFQQIAEIINGKLLNDSKDSLPAHEFAIDSRNNIQTNALFFAIRGKRFHANTFIPELAERGVRHFVIEDDSVTQHITANYILVDNVIQAFQQLAAYHRKQFQIPTIAVTGSNGKTIVKEWLFQLLTQDYSLVKSPKSYNSQVGVPLSVFQMDHYHNMAIFEAGISQKGEMQTLKTILEPTVGLFTNIGSAHNEGFTSRTEKLNEKLLLFNDCATIIYRKDQEVVHQCMQSKFKNKELLAWTLKDNTFGLGKQRLKLPENITSIESENLGHCIATLLYLGYSTTKISKRISELHPVEHRLQIIQGQYNNKLINDSYNNDFGGLKAALEVARQQANGQPFSLILSEFKQTGLKEEEIAEKLWSLLRNYSIDEFIGIGTFFQQEFHQNYSYGKHISTYSSTEEFISTTKPTKFKDSTLLIKGARAFRFEQIIDHLKERRHDTVWEINLSAFTNNVNYFRGLLKPTTKLLVMVKAFAYGTSAKQIAQLLQFQKIDYLGVAYAEEGAKLRKYSITSPILVLNTSEETFPTAVANRLEIETFSISHLRSLISYLKQENIKEYPIHIKLDTGMHRLGFSESAMEKLIEILKSTEFVSVKGIFSHLSSADDDNEMEFTLKQQACFEQMANRILPFCHTKPLLHLLNSAGIVNQQLKQFDMVRLGIGAYGISHQKEAQEQLIQVASLKASVSQIKTIQRGDSVGYNRAFIASEEMRIGILTIGYADGYDRRFGNGTGRVIIRGKKVETLGNICMDMCMVNLSEVPEAEEGDIVIITSPQLPVTELATQIGSIPYELFTNISARIPRRFIVE